MSWCIFASPGHHSEKCIDLFGGKKTTSIISENTFGTFTSFGHKHLAFFCNKNILFSAKKGLEQHWRPCGNSVHLQAGGADAPQRGGGEPRGPAGLRAALRGGPGGGRGDVSLAAGPWGQCGQLEVGGEAGRWGSKEVRSYGNIENDRWKYRK